MSLWHKPESHSGFHSRPNDPQPERLTVTEDEWSPLGIGAPAELPRKRGAEVQGLWKENVQRFGDNVYWAMQGGGAYSEMMQPQKAISLTKSYLDTLFGDTPEKRWFIYALDPGFSCWFCRTYWDLAYVIFNIHENWLALLLATDVD